MVFKLPLDELRGIISGIATVNTTVLFEPGKIHTTNGYKTVYYKFQNKAIDVTEKILLDITPIYSIARESSAIKTVTIVPEMGKILSSDVFKFTEAISVVDDKMLEASIIKYEELATRMRHANGSIQMGSGNQDFKIVRVVTETSRFQDLLKLAGAPNVPIKMTVDPVSGIIVDGIRRVTMDDEVTITGQASISLSVDSLRSLFNSLLAENAYLAIVDTRMICIDLGDFVSLIGAMEEKDRKGRQ